MADTGELVPSADRAAAEAAAWVLRFDRGLTAAEQDAFSQWLAADPRHGEQLARHRRHWQRLEALAQWRPEHSARPNPDLLAPPLTRRFGLWSATVTLAAAAAVAFGLWWKGLPEAASKRPANVPALVAEGAAAVTRRVLDDGTVVELNRGAELEAAFSAGERRVRLTRGEAHFTVAKIPTRPFIVAVGGMDIRAVGTAFNIRFDAAAVEVLVTEGRVQVDDVRLKPAEVRPVPREPLVPVLSAGQRAVVSLAPQPDAPRIATLTAGEIERVLAWQHRMLDFTSTPLAEVVTEFNQRNAVQLVVVDPELAAVRISASFRSDNIEGFVRLLELGFGAQVERVRPNEIILRKAR